MASKANTKHRALTHSTSWKAGWNLPEPYPADKKGGGYPHKQGFNTNLALKGKHRG